MPSIFVCSCSCPHSLLASGRVDPAHPELATDPLGILRPATKLQHQLPLVSSAIRARPEARPKSAALFAQ